jgi:acetylornithine deacetylase/succinyl-diaminopimelate desuccinylase-like protein
VVRGVTSSIAELAAALVAVESVNPALSPDGSGEAEAAELVARWAREAGLSVELEAVRPGRPNVIVTAPGTGGGRTLMLNGHLDTVGTVGTERPFSAEVRAGRLHGRGAYDMKGALAAALVAAARASEERLAGDLVVACVIDEELASAGTEHLLGAHRADGAIVCEPTDERVCVAHRGFVGFEIETRGRAAHGSRPDLGVDAIAAMGPVLTRLAGLAEALPAGRKHELVGTGSVHASLIEGGQEYSSYPERCLLVGERRTIPGESRAAIEEELRRLVDGTGATLRLTLERRPLETDPAHELPQLVARHAGGGLEGVAFWTDGALIAEAGIPAVVFGPRGAGAHEPEEWVELESLERCAQVYLETARAFCGPA